MKTSSPVLFYYLKSLLTINHLDEFTSLLPRARFYPTEFVEQNHNIQGVSLSVQSILKKLLLKNRMPTLKKLMPTSRN